MGAWISLNRFKYFKNQIKGFIGIGAAPEFLDELMWKKFSNKIKKEIRKKVSVLLDTETQSLNRKQYEYPVTHQLFKDGRKNKVFSKKINLKINVTMIHGQKDEVVQLIFLEKFYPFSKKQKNDNSQKWRSQLISKKII